MIPNVWLPDGTPVPALGQGTWGMGERRSEAKMEVAALRAGLEMGLSLVDTAEMYGDGEAERIVGTAIAGHRDRVFVVSKIYPHNASATGVASACNRSLKRLGTDRIDLYLLHWRGSYPLYETITAFERLREAGLIRYWGVSNFDVDDMEELVALSAGTACATNQVLYNLDARGIEFDLMPWCRSRSIPIMAYSPLGHTGGLLQSKALTKVAERHNATAAQIAIAWSLRDGTTISIPKSSTIGHVVQNAGAADIKLTREDLHQIDEAHRPPRRKQPLAIL